MPPGEWVKELGIPFGERRTVAGCWVGNGWRSERVLHPYKEVWFKGPQGEGTISGFNFSDAVGTHAVVFGVPNRAVIKVEWWEHSTLENSLSFTW